MDQMPYLEVVIGLYALELRVVILQYNLTLNAMIPSIWKSTVQLQIPFINYLFPVLTSGFDV